MQLLGGLTPERFLGEYWQKKPLLVRQAIPGFRAPISADELAGLACEPAVESRLILEKGGARPWQLEHGPFAEERFAALPESHWTLLVQRVNHWVPAVADLLDHFAFLPAWRLDDIMISYAADQGSVGPHTDQYDVFLLQGAGRRRWQIDPAITADSPLLDHPDLRILAQFQAADEWVLEPGDMLYLPPGLAHYGVALGEGCMTLSVGFRAPAHRDLITAWVDDVIALLPDTLRYADPDRQAVQHPGELDDGSLARIREIIHQRFITDENIDGWFGRYITQPVDEPFDVEPLSVAEIRSRLKRGQELRRRESARLGYIDGERFRLFFDGEDYRVPQRHRELARLLCDRRHFGTELLSHLEDPKCREWFAALQQQGLLESDDG